MTHAVSQKSVRRLPQFGEHKLSRAIRKFRNSRILRNCDHKSSSSFVCFLLCFHFRGRLSFVEPAIGQLLHFKYCKGTYKNKMYKNIYIYTHMLVMVKIHKLINVFAARVCALYLKSKTTRSLEATCLMEENFHRKC